MSRRARVLSGLAALLSLGGAAAWAEGPAVAEAIDVAPVWSGHPVGFALLTQGTRQFVAFYDAERQMTVGSRDLDARQWQLARLPSTLGWDSHNAVTMAIDTEGLIHVAGNMHGVPLVYFRTERPYDVASFRRVPGMVGRDEQRCTYPQFLHGATGELIFVYRDGASGDGRRFFNRYEPESKTWRRLFDEPLLSGQGETNAYPVGPVCDPQGMFHLCWVWRDTPDCSTNHDLCYARSKDLVHWETSAGRPLTLPITAETAEVVDPVPAGGGMINNNTKLGFDAQGRVVIGYHKFDAAGNTQIYNARRESDGWKIYQTSQWDHRWDFRGGGTIRFEIELGPVTAEPDGSLSQWYTHVKYGSGNWRLDGATLRPTGEAPRRDAVPEELLRLESSNSAMGVRTATDLGTADASGVRYLLRWETLPSNRDRPVPGNPPEPSMLRVYRIGPPRRLPLPLSSSNASRSNGLSR